MDGPPIIAGPPCAPSWLTSKVVRQSLPAAVPTELLLRKVLAEIRAQLGCRARLRARVAEPARRELAAERLHGALGRALEERIHRLGAERLAGVLLRPGERLGHHAEEVLHLLLER